MDTKLVKKSEIIEIHDEDFEMTIFFEKDGKEVIVEFTENEFEQYLLKNGKLYNEYDYSYEDEYECEDEYYTKTVTPKILNVRQLFECIENKEKDGLFLDFANHKLQLGA